MQSTALVARAQRAPRLRAAAIIMATIGFVVGGLALASAPAGASTAAGFTVSGTRIVGPDGQTFLPIGANFQGPHSFWPNATKGRSDAVLKWGWNTIRLNACMVGGCQAAGGYEWPTNDDLDGIVDEYTSKGIVVMIDLHQIAPGAWPNATELPQVISWWRDTAAKYKSNPYVWFDVLNEPGNGSSGTSQWLAIHTTLVDAIRSTGANNVVVVEGTQWGQDAGTWDNNPINQANSALLTYGQVLLQGRSNILFSIHAYDQWGEEGTDAQRDSRLADYIDRVHDAGLALVIGELGGPWDNQASWLSRGTAAAYRVAPGRGVGVLAWHAQPGDGLALTNVGDFDRVDSWTNPTNLTGQGRYLWDLGAANRAARSQPPVTGFVKSPDLATVTSTIGNVDLVWRQPGSLGVSGWAIDPDTAASIPVHLYVDGVLTSIVNADALRPDVGQAFPVYGNNHGLLTALVVGAGSHQVCVYGINIAGPGGNSQLKCVGVYMTDSTIGSFDTYRVVPGGIDAVGWTVDPDTAAPLNAHFYVDGGWAGLTTADDPRPDVAAALPGYGAGHGYDAFVPVAAGVHTVCAYGINGAGSGTNSLLGCRSVNITGQPAGNVDSASSSGPGAVRIAGWALDPDTASTIPVHFYVDGGWGGAYQAGSLRKDVGAAFPGYGDSHGYDITLSLAKGTHAVCVYAINSAGAGSNPQLGCRTVNVT